MPGPPFPCQQAPFLAREKGLRPPKEAEKRRGSAGLEVQAWSGQGHHVRRSGEQDAVYDAIRQVVLTCPSGAQSSG